MTKQFCHSFISSTMSEDNKIIDEKYPQFGNVKVRGPVGEIGKTCIRSFVRVEKSRCVTVVYVFDKVGDKVYYQFSMFRPDKSHPQWNGQHASRHLQTALGRLCKKPLVINAPHHTLYVRSGVYRRLCRLDWNKLRQFCEEELQLEVNEVQRLTESVCQQHQAQPFFAQMSGASFTEWSRFENYIRRQIPKVKDRVWATKLMTEHGPLFG